MLQGVLSIFLAFLSGPAEKAMEPHYSTLAWKIPWTEEPGGLQSMGSLGVGHDWAASHSLFTFMHWRRKWQPTPVFLPGESRGWGDPGGLPSMGSHRVRHYWRDLAAQGQSSNEHHQIRPCPMAWRSVSLLLPTSIHKKEKVIKRRKPRSFVGMWMDRKSSYRMK